MNQDLHSAMSYSLTLSDGQAWNLRAGKGLETWLSRFAGVLRLPVSPCLPGRSDFYVTSDQHTADDFSHDDWYDLSSRYHALYLNRMNGDICCILEGDFLGNRIEETVKMLFGVQGIYASAILRQGLPLHAALISRDGHGIAIAAPGGTGKSTCATRVQYPWTAISDDAGLVVLSGDGKHMIHPMPTWSVFFDYQDWNASWPVEEGVPLELVCTLRRSETDSIEPLGNGNAAALIYQSALQVWRGTQVTSSPEISHQFWIGKVFENSCRLARNVRCVTLNATKDGNFWEEIDRYIESSPGQA